MADLTILFCSDAREWDTYLTQCLLQACESKSLNIHHETLDTLDFPLGTQRAQQFLASKATLVIISPDFLDFVEGKAEVFELGKLLDPSATVAMLCGVRESDVTHLHKAALVSYDSWPRLLARDQDKDFVLDVIKRTQDILTRTEESRTLHKSKFKITPRKVKLGNNKVYVLLNEPMIGTSSSGSEHRLQVFLEGETIQEVAAKSRNPFTLQFLVPDSYLLSSRMLKVHVRLADGGPSYGLQPLKVESQMGELFSLLSAVNSPYELICQTYGVAAHGQVDRLLAESFAFKMPFGLSLLEHQGPVEKKRSEEELPSLVHFAARYGLEDLMNQLLQCPGASQASLLRNSRGLTPGQMASDAGHHHLTALLEEFQKCPSPISEVMLGRESQDRRSSMSSSQQNSYVNVTNGNESMEPPEEPYDVPNRVPLAVQPRKVPDPLLLDDVVPLTKKSLPDCSQASALEDALETGYIDMRILHVIGKEKLLPHEALLLELNTRHREVKNGSTQIEPREEFVDITVSDEPASILDDIDGQHELLQLLERYKKGASMSDVEKDFKIWQTKHNNSDFQGSLLKLKELSKGTNRKPVKTQSFSFPDFKNFFLSKFNKKDFNSNVMESPKLAKKSWPFDDLDQSRPVSTVSSSSSASRASTLSSDRFSTLSFGSAYDSGHQSDSCDEGHKVKGVPKSFTSPSNWKLSSPNPSPNQAGSLYTSPKNQPSPVYSHQKDNRYTKSYPQNQRTPQQHPENPNHSSLNPPPYQNTPGLARSPASKPKLRSKLSISSRPPAPPPRPARLKNLDFKRPSANVELDGVYYNQQDLPMCPISPAYVLADNEDYLLVNREQPERNAPVCNPVPVFGNVCKWKSSSGDYYEVPLLPTSVRGPNPDGGSPDDDQGDYAFPTSFPLPVVPLKSPQGSVRIALHSDYYDIPRPGPLPVELDSDERCDSIPEEIAPPPPMESN